MLLFRDHVTCSCIRPEIPVKPGTLLCGCFVYVFGDLSKIAIFIYTNNPVKTRWIYPQFHWAVYIGMLYLDIDLVLPSCICVLRKTLIYSKADHIKSLCILFVWALQCILLVWALQCILFVRDILECSRTVTSPPPSGKSLPSSV
jgi:hypothetical protein